MSAQLDALTKALRDLPYLDMLKVASIVEEKLNGIHSAHFLADALAAVRPALADEAAEITNEEKAFRRALRRKRNMTLMPLAKGWEVSIPDSPVRAQSTELRVAVNAALDQLIALTLMAGE